MIDELKSFRYRSGDCYIETFIFKNGREGYADGFFVVHEQKTLLRWW